MPLLTQYPHKSGTVPAFDCALNLIDAYLEPFTIKKEAEELAKTLISCTWQNGSNQQINLVRPSPFSSLQGSLAANPKPQPIPSTCLISIISHLGNLSVSLWLDSVHLLSTERISRNSTEYRQLQNLLVLYRQLFYLAKFGGGEEELFWTSMPVKLVKNYKDKLLL